MLSEKHFNKKAVFFMHPVDHSYHLKDLIRHLDDLIRQRQNRLTPATVKLYSYLYFMRILLRKIRSPSDLLKKATQTLTKFTAFP